MQHHGPLTAVPAGRERLMIAGWTLQEERHCLMRDGTAIRLEPKTTLLLAFMARHAGEALRREDLLAEVWQDRVVGDEALTTAINKIRRAFRDDRHDPRIIETIPKTGDRLIAPVERQVENGTHLAVDTVPDGPSAAGVMTPAVDRPRPSRPVYRAALVGALLLLAIGLGVGFLLLSAPAPPPADTAVVDPGPVPMVSVHPFTVLGDDPEQRYLARGLTADLIARLSSLSGLYVTEVSEANTPGDAAGSGVPLDKRYEVWGGVKRATGDLNVEVSLVETSTGRRLWVEHYRRPFDDLFEIQHEIGTRLARALSVQVTELEQERLAHRYTRSVPAYDLFLRARSELLVRRPENNRRARDLYLGAIALDPAFARAYAGLALIHAGDYRNQWTEDRAEALAKAEEFAESALQIDPMLPEVHWTLGYVKVQQRRHSEALAHLDRALAIQPGFADALALTGGINTYLGRPSTTIPLVRSAIRNNPAAGYLYYMTLGRAYYFLGDPVQALINLREALNRNPATLEVRVYLAATLESHGEHDDAEWQAEEIRAIRPGFSIDDWLETYPMVDPRQTERLTAALKALGL